MKTHVLNFNSNKIAVNYKMTKFLFVNNFWPTNIVFNIIVSSSLHRTPTKLSTCYLIIYS